MRSHAILGVFLATTGTVGIQTVARAEDFRTVTTTSYESQPPSSQSPHRVQTVTELMGKTISGRGGENLGKVEDLMIDVHSGRAAYIIADCDEGGRLCMVPLGALSLSERGDKFVLSGTGNRINSFLISPGLLPDFGDHDWVMRIHSHYGVTPYFGRMSGSEGAGHRGEGRARYMTQWQRATDLVGKEVRNPQGEFLGRIDNLSIDPDGHRLMYGVLSFETPVAGNQYTAIPFHSLSIGPGQRHVVVDVEKRLLERAPGFNRWNWPNMASATWAADIRDFFDRRSYGQRSHEEYQASGFRPNREEQPGWRYESSSSRRSSYAGEGAPSRYQESYSDDRQTYARSSPMVLKASELLGLKVTSATGENLGSVDDVILDVESGRLIFTIIDCAQGRQCVIPSAALSRAGGAESLILAGGQQRLATFMFGVNQIPDLRDPSFVARVYTEYGLTSPEKEFGRADKYARQGSSFHALSDARELSKILEKDIRTPDGEVAGQLRDLAIDPDIERIEYAVLSIKEKDGQLVAVPWSILSIPSGELRYLVASVGKDQLRGAPGFKRWEWPSLAEVRFPGNAPPIGTSAFRAGETRNYDDSRQTGYGSATRRSGLGDTPSKDVQKATELLGAVVQAENGQVVGDLEDLIVDVSRGRIAYALIGCEPGEQCVVPAAALTFTATPTVILNSHGPDHLAAFTVDRGQFPELMDRTWAMRIHSHYNLAPYWEQFGDPRRPDQESYADSDEWYQLSSGLRKLSDILDSSVRSANNEVVGEIEDLVIETHTGRVILGILFVKGRSDRLFAMPWSALSMSGEQDHFALSVDRSRLNNAQGFDPRHWPNITDWRWMSDVHGFYGLQFDWQEGARDGRPSVREDAGWEQPYRP